MEEKFLSKMIKQSFLQYGRNLDEAPLLMEDFNQLLEKIRAEKNEQTEWYEVVENVVYFYITNQN